MKAVEKRLFVVGTPRSGTTLLQSFLVSHSKIHSFPETHFFSAIVGNTARRFGLLGKKKLAKYNRLLSDVLEADVARIGGIAARTRGVVRHFTATLDALTLEQGKTIWMEKTPAHLRSVEYIAEHVPESLFIHIIRDGKDVVTSMVEATAKHPGEWGGKRSVESCVTRWNEDSAITLSYRNHPGHFIVQYEKLVESPEEVLQALCSFIGIGFEAGMLSDRIKNAAAIIRPEESWKANNFAELKRSSKFEKLLDASEQTYVREKIADYAKIVKNIGS